MSVEDKAADLSTSNSLPSHQHEVHHSFRLYFSEHNAVLLPQCDIVFLDIRFFEEFVRKRRIFHSSLCIFFLANFALTDNDNKSWYRIGLTSSSRSFSSTWKFIQRYFPNGDGNSWRRRTTTAWILGREFHWAFIHYRCTFSHYLYRYSIKKLVKNQHAWFKGKWRITTINGSH